MYRTGVTYDEFGKLNMKQIRIISNAYSEKLKEEYKTADVIAFIQGRYFVEALLATVGNMFSKNGNFKYPEQAYSLNKYDGYLTEEEKAAQVDAFFAGLRVMQHNFEMDKAQGRI